MPTFDDIEFRTFDFEGFKQSLFDIAKARFPQWTDVLESNQGVVFVEWLGFIAANFAWMQNFQAKQHFVPTVTEAKNLTKLAKQFDYEIPNNVAAIVDLTFRTEDDQPLEHDLIIPKGTQARTTGEESLIFETLENLIMPGGSISGTVGAKHQETKEETITSDGSSDFRAVLSHVPYVEGSMRVTVAAVDWVEVDNFLNSDGNSEHYVLEVDSEGRPTVIFGDDNNGKIPPADDLIVLTYKVGGGSKGIVAPGTITILDDTFIDAGGDPITLTVTNDDASQGGADREPIERSKINIPKSIGAKEVTIGYEDFEAIIGNVAGVGRVRILTVNDNPLIEENTVLAVVLPEEGDIVSEALRTEIEEALADNPPPLTQCLIIVDPQFVSVAIDIRDLVTTPEFASDIGIPATASIEIIDNNFDVGDKVTINGISFEVNVDWLPGGDPNASASNLATVIEVAIPEIQAEVDVSTINMTVKTPGAHGNDYTLSLEDGVTPNFILSGANFENGEDSTVQAAIKQALEDYFGRDPGDFEDEQNVDFGTTIFRNRIIWVIQDVEGVESFNLVTPVGDTLLEINEFPTHSVIFSTS